MLPANSTGPAFCEVEAFPAGCISDARPSPCPHPRCLPRHVTDCFAVQAGAVHLFLRIEEGPSAELRIVSGLIRPVKRYRRLWNEFRSATPGPLTVGRP